MITLKRFPYALVVALCALTAGARAQSAAIEVAADEGRVEFSSPAGLAEMRIEIFAPSGELVFDSGAVTGTPVEWKMQTAAGERVADGVYLATITVTDSSGKRRKRIEQLTVSSEAKATGPPSLSSGPISGAGNKGTIAKFTDTLEIADSIIKESDTGRVGVGTSAAPTATLQVNGPALPASASNGTNAVTLLQTSGGNGGATTVGGGKSAGSGASISLVAGNGGSAPATSKRGKGGSITLQPGSTGGGAGIAAPNGNVLLDPSGVGNVGIGTASPAAKLHVVGSIKLTGVGNGVTFADGKTQTTAALTTVQHSTALTGLGTAASPLGIASSGVTAAHLASKSVGVSELNTTNVAAAGQVLTYNAGGLSWQTPAGGGGGGGVIAFRHTRTAATNCGPAGQTTEFSPLNHASLNGNANAKIFITPIVDINGAGTNNDANQQAFVVYTGATAFGTCPAGRWLIRGGDAEPSNFEGAKYDVLIVN